MADARAMRAVRQLLEKTQRKEVPWTTTDPDTGVFRFGASKARVEVGSRDQDNQPPYAVWVFNKEGHVVDFLDEDEVNEEDYQAIHDLAVLIREQYLRVDETYSDLFRAIDQTPPF
jgi:hypothetical protein